MSSWFQYQNHRWPSRPSVFNYSQGSENDLYELYRRQQGDVNIFHGPLPRLCLRFWEGMHVRSYMATYLVCLQDLSASIWYPRSNGTSMTSMSHRVEKCLPVDPPARYRGFPATVYRIGLVTRYAKNRGPSGLCLVFF